MSAADFLDVLLETPKNTDRQMRALVAMTEAEQAEVRDEALRRLVAGEMPMPPALTILTVVGPQGIEPELIRLLRSPDASLQARSAALILLRRTDVDLTQELQPLDPQTRIDLIEEVLAFENAIQIAAQKGTPFEAIATADPEDEDLDIDEVINDLLEAFYASPEAAEAADAHDLRRWVDVLVRYGIVYGLGSPAFWDADAVEEILTTILPSKVQIESATDATSAIPSFRTFLRWTARVSPAPHAAAIDAFLQQIAPEFPTMMMDQARFGRAKSFVMAGTAAGFDMSTEEGIFAFQQQWNEPHAAPRLSTSNKKTDAAKKRKAKMAKLSRRKNRRRK